MKYAVVKVGGTQYKVSPGDIITVNKLNEKKGKMVSLEEVLLFVDVKKISLGQPVVKGAKVKAEIIDHFLGDKIRVATYKAKARTRRVKGFRSKLTRIKILDIREKSS